MLVEELGALMGKAHVCDDYKNDVTTTTGSDGKTVRTHIKRCSQCGAEQSRETF